MVTWTCPTSVEITDFVKANGLAAALAEYSDITDEKDAAMIETFYKMLERRAPFAEFLPVLADILRTEHFVQALTDAMAKQGKTLRLYLGHSLVNGMPQSTLVVTEPDGITFEVPNPNTIVVKGIDKQVVGQFAAEIREKRPPEPYKGKGIKYVDEYMRRKEGKAGKK